MARPWIVFDANGTLFDLRAVAPAVGGDVVLEAWFQRVLHGAATVTLAGTWTPFDELAAAALATTCAKLGLDPVDQAAALEALQQLPAFPDAREAIDLTGGQAAILTNGSAATTRALVERAGLPIETIVSCEEVRAYKPGAPPYELARERLGEDAVLVAAHAWDVAGARAAGLRAIWVDRAEQRWPLPGIDPGERANSLVDAVTLALG
jgi:2-haloacid dehalogenase